MVENTQTTEKKTERELKEAKSKRIMDTVAWRAAYYRENPHRLCEDYLNIHLKPFQKILIKEMDYNNYNMFLASRGLGKTYLTAIFCVVRCILYPGTLVVIAAGRRRQSLEVIEKITNQLMPNSSNLRAEISKTIANQTEGAIEFYNGSRIKTVTASDTARGSRAHVLLVDEFRMVDKDVIQTILRKFLVAPRQPRYLEKPEYKHLAERNKEIYASSCFFRSHWSYEKVKSYSDNMLDDKRKYFACSLPYQIAIKENLLSREQVEDEMSESDFNSVTWQMEMQALFYSDTDGSLFSYEDIERTRKIKHAVYPNSMLGKINDRRVKIQPKQKDEIRILSADIALMSSNTNNNDATAIFLNQMMKTPSGKYVSNITYTVNYEGLRTDEQALVIRKLVDEFDVDYLVIDSRGLGIGVVDMLMTDLYDSNTGITYSAISCLNDKDIADRCYVPNARKIIYAMFGSAELNSKCALTLREAFQQGSIRLLDSEYNCEEYLQELGNAYNKLTPAEKMALKMPYINTTLLTTELVELQYEVKNNVVRVKERAGKRKDRYSSLGYNIYVAKELEQKDKKTTVKKSTNGIAFKFKAPNIMKRR